VKSNRLNGVIFITAISLVVNIAFSLVKGTAGYFGNSQALIADAVHSMSDFFSDGVIIIGILAASRPVDEDHRYGHGKFETLATVVLGFFLITVSVGIIKSSIDLMYQIYRGNVPEIPGFFVLIVAFISILAKEGLFHVTAIYARQHKSKALEANAWHHRSDALSSVAVLAGSGAAYFLGKQWIFLDPAAGILVGIMVLKVGFAVIKESGGELLERSLSVETEKEIIRIIDSVSGAKFPHRLRTRKIGSEIAVDVHILVDPKLNIIEAHEISTEVEDAICETYGEGTFVSVHIEPNTQKERDKIR
jgi:cation diffusion facilitator family transporter